MKDNATLLKLTIAALVIIQSLVVYIYTQNNTAHTEKVNDLKLAIKEHDAIIRQLQMSVKVIEDDIYEVTTQKRK